MTQDKAPLPHPLPVDVFLDIFYWLSIKDILNIRKTNKNFCSLTRLRSVWYRLLQTHVLAQNIPLPAHLSTPPLSTLSAAELEDLTFRALRLRRNWSSTSPTASRTVAWPAHANAEDRPRCIAIQFLPGRSGRWIISITACMGASPRAYIVQCWDLEAPPSPTCVAIRRIHGLRSWAVNTDPTSAAMLVLQFPHTELLTINFFANDPRRAFVSIAVFPDQVREIHALTGSTIATRDANTEDVILWDIETPELEIGLHNPELLQPEKCQAIIMQENHALVISTTTLEIYSLSAYRAGLSLTAGPHAARRVLHPIAQHKFQWRIDNVVVSPLASTAAPSAPRPLPSVNILIRFGSWYPWPINILHHFVLDPTTPQHPSHVGIPYLLPPTMASSIASPVRLFAASAITLGAYGTALWVDSHTEDYFAHADTGQRLAGCVLTGGAGRTSDLGGESDDSEDGGGEEGDGPSEHVPSTAAAGVYAVRERDGWVRIAMDESAGRIALGCADGMMELKEYQ